MAWHCQDECTDRRSARRNTSRSGPAATPGPLFFENTSYRAASEGARCLTGLSPHPHRSGSIIRSARRSPARVPWHRRGRSGGSYGRAWLEQGKGRKDRYVTLSPYLHAVLQAYAKGVQPHTVLFPSRAGGGPLSPRSIYRVFMRAKTRARIRKHVYPYSLRHAYATHLLEGGANLRVIQLLLGHRSLRTTQVYTQVADTQLQATPSPLDRLPDLPGLPPATA